MVVDLFTPCRTAELMTIVISATPRPQTDLVMVLVAMDKLASLKWVEDLVEPILLTVSEEASKGYHTCKRQA